MTFESLKVLRAQTSRKALMKKSPGNSGATVRCRRDLTIRAPDSFCSANHPAARPCTVNGIFSYPPRGAECALVIMRSQHSCNRPFTLSARVQPHTTVLRRESISGTKSAPGHRDKKPARNHGDCAMSLVRSARQAATGKPILGLPSRDLVARSAAALVHEVSERAALAVLDEHSAARPAHIIAPASGRCTISKGCITAQQNGSVAGRGLLDDAHRNGRDRYNCGSGHSWYPISDPPRHAHSSRLAEALL